MITESKDKNKSKTADKKLSKETIKIAEKVKFWQEQDQINKAIIPRVIKNHELISEISKQSSEYFERIAIIDQKSTVLKNEVVEMNDRVREIENGNSAVNDLIKTVNVQENRIKRQEKMIKIMLGLSSLAIILGLLALVN